jgi:atypical dual specificity phosphatase
MTQFRSFLPNKVNDFLGYYYGMCREMIQPYLNNNYKIYHIVDNIYLGDLSASVKKDDLKKDGITHILSIFNGSYSMWPDFNYKHIHINDDPWVSIDKYFDSCYEFIDSATNVNGKILIHCIYGVSRSVTIIISYLMKKYEITRQDALNLIKSKKPSINPNKGFILQLENVDKQLNNK